MDSGSQVTGITEKCVARLGLQSKQADIQISGIGGNPSAKSGSIVQPYHSPIHTIAVILEPVAKLLPNFTVNSEKLNSLKGIQWADPNFMTLGDIDVILGGDVFEQIVGTEKQAITKELFARSTVFGWVVSGKVSTNNSTSFPQVHHVTLDDQLKRFWELEELPSVEHWTPEEKACEMIFEETTELANHRGEVILQGIN